MLTEDEKAVPIALDLAQRSLGRRIVRSVVFGGWRYAFIVPIPFVMTPLILHNIRVPRYGARAVFLAINGLTSLADLGLVETLSKFAAEYRARQDFPALARLLGSGLALFLLLDFVIGAPAWLASPLPASAVVREAKESR